MLIVVLTTMSKICHKNNVIHVNCSVEYVVKNMSQQYVHNVVMIKLYRLSVIIFTYDKNDIDSEVKENHVC